MSPRRQEAYITSQPKPRRPMEIQACILEVNLNPIFPKPNYIKRKWWEFKKIINLYCINNVNLNYKRKKWQILLYTFKKMYNYYKIFFFLNVYNIYHILCLQCKFTLLVQYKPIKIWKFILVLFPYSLSSSTIISKQNHQRHRLCACCCS